MENKKISELPQTDTINDGCCLPIVQNNETKKIYYSDLKSQVRPTFSINATGHLIATYTDTNEHIDLGVVVGSQGEHGIDIDSVIQTTTSTEDEGINIVTVTLSDGTISTFNIRNGHKGNKGDKGDKGDTGSVDNVFPVGSIYQQLPPVTISGTTYTPKPPMELWENTTWVDISSGYGGAFFRANGGNSSTFGTKQTELIKGHTHTFSGTATGGSHTHSMAPIKTTFSSAQSNSSYSDSVSAGSPWNSGTTSLTISGGSHSHTVSGTASANSNAETRPENYSIKIWLRTE